MDDFSNYAGQSVHIEHLRREFSTGQFTHAYLFVGPEGTGKKSVARLCAQAALCQGAKKPCGECGPCRRFLAGTHPDFHILEPESGKREISVGRMRDMLRESDVHSFEGGYKVFFIPNAEKMNTASQNTLLKTLEEPPEGTVFLLTTVHVSAILPTIVSRCRLIRFHPLTDEETRARLRTLGVEESQIAIRARISEGCVGQALAIGQDTFELREQIAKDFLGTHSVSAMPAIVNKYKDEKDNRQKIFELLEEIVREIMCVQSGIRDGSNALSAVAKSYAEHVPLEGGIALRESIITCRKMMNSNVNFQAVVETVLFEISEEYKKWPW